MLYTIAQTEGNLHVFKEKSLYALYTIDQYSKVGRGEYFQLFAKIYWGIVCWISLAGVEFVLKAWIYLF